MDIVPLILQILALVCFAIAAGGWFTAPAPRPVWGWLGMFLLLLSWMISGSLHATGGPPTAGYRH